MFTPCLVFGANPSTEEKSNVTVSCKLRFSFDVIFTEPETFSEDVNSTLYSFAVSESDWEVFESNAKDDEGVERTLKSASDIAKEETTPLIATSQHPFLRPLHGGATSPGHIEETLAQILEIIGSFKVKRLSRSTVNEITMHGLVGPTDRTDPSFQDVMFTGVMFGMGIKEKITLFIGSNPLSIEPGQGIQMNLGGNPLQFLTLRVGKTDHTAQ